MREEQINELRGMLRDLFRARYEGVPAAKLSRAHGYVDGYMAALLRAKMITQRELLALIGEERARVAGPALSTTSTTSTLGSDAFASS